MNKVDLTTEEFHRIAKAVSDPNRFEMLRLIFRGPEGMTCGCVSNEMPITAATASHHLKELESAGLVEVTKCGRFRKLAPKREVWSAYLEQLQDL